MPRIRPPWNNGKYTHPEHGDGYARWNSADRTVVFRPEGDNKEDVVFEAEEKGPRQAYDVARKILTWKEGQ
jgi:hypothetical protein